VGFLLFLALSGQAKAGIIDADLVVSNATVELVKNTADSTDSLAEISFTFSNTDVSGSGDEACTSNDDPLINTSQKLVVILYSGFATSATVYLDFPITIVGTGRGESDTILAGVAPSLPVSDAELTRLSTVAGACYTESFHAVVSELPLNNLIAQINDGHPLVLTVSVNDHEDTGSITIPAANVEIH
jgi:hypothetical protein